MAKIDFRILPMPFSGALPGFPEYCKLAAPDQKSAETTALLRYAAL
jgi:hypothetical protein